MQNQVQQALPAVLLFSPLEGLSSPPDMCKFEASTVYTPFTLWKRMEVTEMDPGHERHLSLLRVTKSKIVLVRSMENFQSSLNPSNLIALHREALFGVSV